MFGTVLLIVALVVLAMVLVLLEILTPSLGLLSIMALGALVAAVLTAFIEVGPVFGWALAAGCIVLTPVYIVLLVKWLPSSSLGRKVFLGRAREGSGEGTPKAEGLETLIGAEGVAATDLRPVGKVRIDGQRIDARAESNMIDIDAPVRVIGATGTEVIVREIPADAGAETGAEVPAPAGESE